MMDSNIFSCEHLGENKICIIDGNTCSLSCECYNSCENCIHNDGTFQSCLESNGCTSSKQQDPEIFDYDIVSILNSIKNSKK